MIKTKAQISCTSHLCGIIFASADKAGVMKDKKLPPQRTKKKSKMFNFRPIKTFKR